MIRPLLAVTAVTLLAAAGAARQISSLIKLTDKGLLGPYADSMQRKSEPSFAPKDVGLGLIFNGPDDVIMADQALELPTETLSVGASISVESPQRWGGAVGCLEDNGGFEQGWILGYDETSFTFGISTEATDDGDGKLVYLKADRPYKLGVMYEVSAWYDGNVAELAVNGRVAARSEEPGGKILYPDSARLTMGAYRDRDEFYPHNGRIRSAEIIGQPRTALFWEKRLRGRGKPAWTDETFDWRVAPYLTWPRTDGVTVLAEANWPADATLRYRRDDQTEWSELPASGPAKALHEFALSGLESDAKYFYQVTATRSLEGSEPTSTESPVRSFRTAPGVTTGAFTFAVIGDTQTDGAVAKRVSDLAFEQRPNFVVHCGDLVDTGGTKADWTKTFFPNMRPLLEHAPMISVLGNHEQDAKLYYDYMALPEPERWYTVTYGAAQFFMLDGNRSLADQTSQLVFLERELKASTARWKFVVLHQPPYTSDSNDYGDTVKEASTRGDMNARNIVKLLEQYGVDICFSGHVHDYERTFPIKEGKAVSHGAGGVMYVTSAGGGGHLEDFDGTNTWFGHKKARRHHFVQVSIHGDELELHAIDENGRLFDATTLTCRVPE